jgi:hypothetical protein
MQTNADILRSKGYTYIYHITQMENYNKMMNHPFILTPIERHERKIDVLGVLSIEEINFSKDYKISTCGYPGIYMGITHKSLEELRENNEDGCLLIFPLELMNQKNWHFNCNDRNGFFFPDTITFDKIDEIPHSSEIPRFNEIVFHNQISLSNLIEVIGKGAKWKPTFELILDLRTPPCYIYYTGSSYSGIEYSFFRSPSETKVSREFMFQWYQTYLPSPWKGMIQKDMELNEMNLFLFKTFFPESGHNLVDYYFRNRISI